MIKVIASDMDGTLLANDGKIKEKTLTSMYKAMKAGIRFILVTGRGPNGVAQALNKFHYPVIFTCIKNLYLFNELIW